VQRHGVEVMEKVGKAMAEHAERQGDELKRSNDLFEQYMERMSGGCGQRR
jgi:hypothetical protein